MPVTTAETNPELSAQLMTLVANTVAAEEKYLAQKKMCDNLLETYTKLMDWSCETSHAHAAAEIQGILEGCLKDAKRDKVEL